MLLFVRGHCFGQRRESAFFGDLFGKGRVDPRAQRLRAAFRYGTPC